MDSKTYQQLAEKTLSGKFYASEDKTLQNLIHGAVGMVTEASELYEAVINEDYVNIGEELGDFLWYVSIFERELDYKFDSAYTDYGNDKVGDLDWSEENVLSVLNDTAIKLMVESGKLLDSLKKATFYGRPLLKLAVPMTSTLNKIVADMSLMFFFLGQTVENSRRVNIAKLSARYPDGFSEFFAQNRDLEAELRILSQKD
jgi:NTP pyrophosphatase (non-canonical NTP hydrolase)